MYRGHRYGVVMNSEREMPNSERVRPVKSKSSSVYSEKIEQVRQQIAIIIGESSPYLFISLHIPMSHQQQDSFLPFSLC